MHYFTTAFKSVLSLTIVSDVGDSHLHEIAAFHLFMFLTGVRSLWDQSTQKPQKDVGKRVAHRGLKSDCMKNNANMGTTFSRLTGGRQTSKASISPKLHLTVVVIMMMMMMMVMMMMMMIR